MTCMRKFLFSSGVLTSVFSAVGLVKATRSGPRDWRLALMWVGWGVTVAIAVGTVLEQARESRELED